MGVKIMTKQTKTKEQIGRIRFSSAGLIRQADKDREAKAMEGKAA